MLQTRPHISSDSFLKNALQRTIFPNRVASPIEIDIWYTKRKKHDHDRHQRADIECSRQDVIILKRGETQSVICIKLAY